MPCMHHDIALDHWTRLTGTMCTCRQSIPMPGLGSVAGFSGRKEDTQLFFMFTGFTEPGAIYQCVAWHIIM